MFFATFDYFESNCTDNVPSIRTLEPHWGRYLVHRNISDLDRIKVEYEKYSFWPSLKRDKI